MRSDRSIAVVFVCVIFPVIASLTVCLRVYSQTLKGHGVSADDYIVLSGLVRNVSNFFAAYS